MRVFTDEQKAVFGRFYFLRKQAGKEVPKAFEECYEYYINNIHEQEKDAE